MTDTNGQQLLIEAEEQLTALKQQGGKLITNLLSLSAIQGTATDLKKTEGALALTVQENFRRRVYFAALSEQAARDILRGCEQGVFTEHLYKEENDFDELITSAGFVPYKKYVRCTEVCFANGYEIPLKGRDRILQEMYDPTCGEYPSESDIDELYELTLSLFDKNCTEVLSREEWRDTILARECMVYRENGRIISCYVWHREGKKLYSKLAINLGTANFLYNMERRIGTEAWNDGIRIYYAWFRCDNVPALERHMRAGREEQWLKRREMLYDQIYCMQAPVSE